MIRVRAGHFVASTRLLASLVLIGSFYRRFGLPYVQHVAELLALLKDFVYSRDSLLQSSADPEKRHPSFGEIADNLVLKPSSLLISTTIPCVGVRDIYVTEKE